uniref:Uncharacterized protein n=1 Tax=Strombidinopsis acuminata TaxID=141414 RepID=A0A7S3X935_9SPIT
MKMKIDAGLGQRADILEELRKSCVGTTRTGNNYVFNIGKSVVDFKEMFNEKDVFPADKIFDREEWNKEENYMKIVKEEENVDLSGYKGQYVKSDTFHVVIIAAKSDEETLQKQMAAIPHIEKFRKIEIS